MYAILSALFVFLFCLPAYSGNAINVTAAIQPGVANIYRPGDYSLRTAAVISNGKASYRLILTVSKPGVYGLPYPCLKLHLDAGEFNFSPLVDFLTLRINGIPMNKLCPKGDGFTQWKERECAGVELRLNYNGARVVFRFFMRPDSDVLWGALRRDRESPVEITRAELKFISIPSKLIMNGKKPVWQGGYARAVVTPVRTIRQSGTRLNHADSWLILQDDLLDGSSPAKGMGPGWIFLDFASISAAEVNPSDNYILSVNVSLKHGFELFCFGLLQSRSRIANMDLFKRIQDFPEAFTY